MNNKTRRRRRSQAGLTLLEIMIVFALIGLLTATIGRSVFKQWKEGKRETAQSQVRDLAATVQSYVITRKTCPTVEDLVRENFLRSVPVDPWNTAIASACPGEHDKDGVDVVSFGPDRKENTEDDLRS